MAICKVPILKDLPKKFKLPFVTSGIMLKLGEGELEQFELPTPTEAEDIFEGVEFWLNPLNCWLLMTVGIGGVGPVGEARFSCPRFNVANPARAAAVGSVVERGGDGD